MAPYWQEFLAIIIAHAIAVSSPGPDFAVVTKNTLKYGKRIGVWTAFGVGTAILLHVTYAVLGFSLFISQNNTAFLIVKYLGALFLLYLGVLSLRASPQANRPETTTTEQESLSFSKAYIQGFLVNALNVKAVLFFLSLFTAIVSTTTPQSIQIVYGLWMSVATFAWFSFVANVFGYPPVRNFFSRFGHILDWIMGIILIGLAIWLALGKA
ncbi:MAG: LysE family transporter [Saprospiraceae bacterium]|nr:LysE family transporter [Saprospiraceae bacterium]